MRVLITGAGGFVGTHMARHLRECGDIPLAFALPGEPVSTDFEASFAGDIADANSIGGAVRSARPDACVHLAGVSSVIAARSDPALAVRTNVTGTVMLLEAFRNFTPGVRTLVVTTAQIYGTHPGISAVDEESPLKPDNIYAATKAAADMLARQWATDRGQFVCVARPGNHIGPGQTSSFVVASFAHQVAAIAAGRKPNVLRVGNLDSTRDFMDVRDVVRAYRLLLERGEPGQAYNLARGEQYTIRSMLDRLCEAAGIQPRIEVDPALFRPTDATAALDTRKIHAATGWRTTLSLDRTLTDMLAGETAQAVQGG
ncbi:MAG: GDP-mannose 4,6-dehydratase [Kiritimatiellae bacterium]|nr:GDP-mannose 4,6-dehydratase [Kiritimatiellia bacterium]